MLHADERRAYSRVAEAGRIVWVYPGDVPRTRLESDNEVRARIRAQWTSVMPPHPPDMSTYSTGELDRLLEFRGLGPRRTVVVD